MPVVSFSLVIPQWQETKQCGGALSAFQEKTRSKGIDLVSGDLRGSLVTRNGVPPLKTVASSRFYPSSASVRDIKMMPMVLRAMGAYAENVAFRLASAPAMVVSSA